MRNILVTGSSGHLGEALMRTLRQDGHAAIGLDVTPGPVTDVVGSITDRAVIKDCMRRGVRAVLHTAALHKPHVATHARQRFIAANIVGTLNLLEEAIESAVTAFVLTSTTSAFGRALQPPPDAPAAWITEDVTSAPKNIYGVSKTAAEDLCELFHQMHRLPCLILRTSRFFFEPDDDAAVRDAYDGLNAKVNELLYRRVDIDDVVTAHLLALDKAATIGFGRYIITATTPFTKSDLSELATDAPAVVSRYVPQYHDVYRRLGWRMFPRIDRVYVNVRARAALGWQPRHDFAHAIRLIEAGQEPQSSLARTIGFKGYGS